MNQWAINNYVERFDILSYLDEFCIDYEDSGTNIIIKECLVCGKSKKMSVRKDNGIFGCFTCGEKGNLFGLMSVVEDIPKNEIFKREIVKIESDSENEKRIDVSELHRFDLKKVDIKNINDVYVFGKLGFPPNYQQVDLGSDSDGAKYLSRRGVDQKMVDVFDIRYSPTEKRVVFPFYWNGDLVGWQGRDITGTSYLKALTKPDGFNKKSFLFNFDNLPKDAEFVTIVEGPVDCVKSYRFNSVALLGSSLSQAQLNLLLSLKKMKTVFLALDPEEDLKLEKTYKMLSPFYKVFDVSVLPSGCGDLGDCTENQVAESLAIANEYNSVYMSYL